jgi:hypothetical protein
MRNARLAVVASLVLGLSVGAVQAGPYEERSLAARIGYGTVAVAANIVPILSAVWAPNCLPGYFACKLSFAGISLITAGAQVSLSGVGDTEQTRAILHRGFSGDWWLTGRHIAGDATPEPLPEAAPPRQEGTPAGWEPPPL